MPQIKKLTVKEALACDGQAVVDSNNDTVLSYNKGQHFLASRTEKSKGKRPLYKFNAAAESSVSGDIFFDAMMTDAAVSRSSRAF